MKEVLFNITKMLIDKFGRSFSSKKTVQTFGVTEAGDFDFNHKRICNLYKPININDAANKFYVDEKIVQNSNAIKNEVRLKLAHSFDTIRKLETKLSGLNETLKSLEKFYNNLNTKFTEEKLNKSVIIALPQKQNPQPTPTSVQSSNEQIASTTSSVTVPSKKMRIE